MCEMSDFIPTRGSALKKNPEQNFVVSTFESYKKKEKRNLNVSKGPVKMDVAMSRINMSKAKHEVIKLGMSGFDSLKKEEAKVQLAIKLGAKPPKNKSKNYKLLLQDKRKEQKMMQKDSAFLQLGKSSMGKSTAKGKTFDRKHKRKEGLLDVYGTVKVAKK